MDRIGEFLVSNKNDYQKINGGHLRTLPNGTKVKIDDFGRRRVIQRLDGLTYFTEKNYDGNIRHARIKKYGSQDIFMAASKSGVKKAQRLQKFLLNILPNSIKEAINIDVVKGKWVRL